MSDSVWLWTVKTESGHSFHIIAADLHEAVAMFAATPLPSWMSAIKQSGQAQIVHIERHHHVHAISYPALPRQSQGPYR